MAKFVSNCFLVYDPSPLGILDRRDKREAEAVWLLGY